MSIDDLMMCNGVSTAFLTAALLPYSENYALENDCNGFVDTACRLYLDICSCFDELLQL